MKKMSELSYHYGLKLRIYPSAKQKQIIKLNSDVARTVYNKLLSIDHELYQLKQVKLPIDSILERIDELKQRKQYKYLINHYQFMQDKNIDSSTVVNAKRNYQKAWQLYNQAYHVGTPKFHKKSHV